MPILHRVNKTKSKAGKNKRDPIVEHTDTIRLDFLLDKVGRLDEWERMETMFFGNPSADMRTVIDMAIIEESYK